MVDNHSLSLLSGTNALGEQLWNSHHLPSTCDATANNLELEVVR